MERTVENWNEYIRDQNRRLQSLEGRMHDAELRIGDLQTGTRAK